MLRATPGLVSIAIESDGPSPLQSVFMSPFSNKLRQQMLPSFFLVLFVW